ncbi:hypothetical protein QR680_018650 [Steinernema hermaphroditum]|uniref:Thyroglobulin type-1 domain-containing protein n=1 Tax=Steinernema hermaphroditum TaxID=289476 RepID=A0AA39LR31_9BILA|nr:hypothetical protein QR680_018650 [Steinernema hermaphroditum]
MKTTLASLLLLLAVSVAGQIKFPRRFASLESEKAALSNEDLPKKLCPCPLRLGLQLPCHCDDGQSEKAPIANEEPEKDVTVCRCPPGFPRCICENGIPVVGNAVQDAPTVIEARFPGSKHCFTKPNNKCNGADV